MELKIAEELERKARRQKLLVQINILEGYRSNVRQAIQRLEEGKNMYRQGHSNYTPSWQGESRNAYEQMAAELNHTGNKAYNTGEELISAINRELNKLRDQAEALR